MPFLIKILLYPLSLVYGSIVLFRNKLFDFNILKSKEFHIPVISVGNITVGGTGKTPHIEYLIELLSDEYKIAVLSRGYKRKTREFIIATQDTPVSSIGDESWQLKKKFPNITIAVDSNRVRGIEKIIEAEPEIDIILLDDAFQHRYVKPGVNILLIDYSRQLYNDFQMPFGWLRESPNERFRADVIIITKSPLIVTPIDKRLMLNKLELANNQHAFFTSIIYKEPEPFIGGAKPITFNEIAHENYNVLLVAGIANPKPLIAQLQKYSNSVKTVLFPDHHFFSEADLRKIQLELNALQGENKIVITTEKDVSRLKEFETVITTPESWYYVPIKIDFHQGEAELFTKYVLHYVRNNNRNSLLYKRKSKV